MRFHLRVDSGPAHPKTEYLYCI
uniref:Uncharacterized protein n=1 Tax=Anguilla anguilla TaxID=7936 RepID=A0A0E9RFT2_ANGAN